MHNRAVTSLCILLLVAIQASAQFGFSGEDCPFNFSFAPVCCREGLFINQARATCMGATNCVRGLTCNQPVPTQPAPAPPAPQTCDDIQCQPFQICAINSFRRPACFCNRSCPRGQECNSDGTGCVQERACIGFRCPAGEICDRAGDIVSCIPDPNVVPTPAVVVPAPTPAARRTCADIQCQPFQSCTLNGFGRPTCFCNRSCPRGQECNSDGTGCVQERACVGFRCPAGEICDRAGDIVRCIPDPGNTPAPIVTSTTAPPTPASCTGIRCARGTICALVGNVTTCIRDPSLPPRRVIPECARRQCQVFQSCKKRMRTSRCICNRICPRGQECSEDGGSCVTQRQCRNVVCPAGQFCARIGDTIRCLDNSRRN